MIALREAGAWLVALLLVAGAATGCGGDDDDDNDDGGDDLDGGGGRADALGDADSWLYQLQNVDPDAVAESGFDVVVTDYSEDGTADAEWSPGDVSTLRAGGRIALCYLSIGEAEDYRWYWDETWGDDPPDWLSEENPDWPGNYKVKFWDPEWQAIIFEYLDTILAQGFDGAYLDIIDAYEYWQDDGVDDADRRMIDFVIRLADHARAAHPGFLVFPQNASDLVWDDDYLATIDGLGAEDTWYNDDDPQPEEETAYTLENLGHVIDAGREVLAVDYVREPAHIDDFYAKAEAHGFIPYATVRDLDEMIVNPGHEP